mgnify:CR=1 FL=1
MKICNYSIYKFIIICLLQNSNLYSFQNTEKSTESLDLIQLSVTSETIENEFDEKSSSKKFIVQKRKKEQKDSIYIGMYKIFDYERKSISVDTSLTIKKEYTNNFLRKDYFELLPFVNMGHAFNRLGYDFFEENLIPQIGKDSKHSSYFKSKDIKYYNVPTPFTELFFKTTMEQGQLSDALITLNLNPNFNFAIAYRGMRSQGKYVNQRSNNEAFRYSFNFNSKNHKYNFIGHYVSQNIGNNENGGITEQSLSQFELGDPEFKERSVLNVRLKRAYNELKGKRSFFRQNYFLKGTNNLINGNSMSIFHEFLNETKFYIYEDIQRSEYFGSLVSEQAKDQVNWAVIQNSVGVNYNNNKLGRIKGAIEYHKTDYFFKNFIESSTDLNHTIIYKQIFLSGNYLFKWKGFNLNTYFKKTISGDYRSDLAEISGKIIFKEKNYLEFGIKKINKAPDLNFILYKSAYQNYNWYNENLNNEDFTLLTSTLYVNKIGKFNISYQKLNNYIFYRQNFDIPADLEIENEEDIILYPTKLLTTVNQFNGTIDYLKIRYDSNFKYRKFELSNTVQYQKSENEDSQIHVLNTPEWNLRTSLSFSSFVFKKAMYLQFGVTGQYFSKFFMNKYNPLLGSFLVQNKYEIGDFPRLDFFVNGKIKKARLFLKYEHFNSSFTGYDFFSSEGYPYRDAMIRFGIVWNFFE